jgi:hypothetical protein
MTREEANERAAQWTQSRGLTDTFRSPRQRVGQDRLDLMAQKTRRRGPLVGRYVTARVLERR